MILNQCRACRAPDPYLFLALGDHAPAQMLGRDAEQARTQARFPLNAQVCLACGLIQIADQIPPDFFRHYLYVPSGAATMQDHFRDFAALLASRVAADRLIVDIGCNDGLLLADCNARGCTTLGVDPAQNIADLAAERDVAVHVDYFRPDAAHDIVGSHGKAAVIVTSNTFNHIGDLHEFMRAVDILLDEDGTFIVEVPRAKELIDQNEFDNIYHEHVSEFSLLSLVKLAAQFDLHVTDLHLFGHIHGGSMRVFITRRGMGLEPAPIVQEALEAERAGGMLEQVTYDALADRVEALGAKLRQMLSDMKEEGLRIAGYGASARGNTLITYYGIDDRYLDFLVDKNPLKHGLYAPNTGIPIRDVTAIEEEAPDVLFVLAWNFFDEIRKQQASFLARGGKFVVPLPQPAIVAWDPLLAATAA